MTEKKKILIVDDDPDVLRVIRLLLGEDYRVLEASNAERALELFEKRKPDMVLLDMELSDARENEVLAAILESDPKAVVVMLTGNQSLGTAREAMRLGARDYVAKPFSPDHLKDVVSQHLA